MSRGITGLMGPRFQPGTTQLRPVQPNPLLDPGHGEIRYHVRWGGGSIACGCTSPMAALEYVLAFHRINVPCDVVITRTTGTRKAIAA